jgi:hypothetical protein
VSLATSTRGVFASSVVVVGGGGGSSSSSTRFAASRSASICATASSSPAFANISAARSNAIGNVPPSGSTSFTPLSRPGL